MKRAGWVLAGTWAAVTTASAAPPSLPDGMTLPDGVSEDNHSQLDPFSFVEVGYPKDGQNVHETHAGKTWTLALKLATPNKSPDDTSKMIRKWLKGADWEMLAPNGKLVARRTVKGKTQWLAGDASGGDARLTIVEEGPAPHALKLAPPGKTPEAVGDGDDWPYLAKLPGAKLKATTADAKWIDAIEPGPGDRLRLAGPPVTAKTYDLPAGADAIGAYERMVIYRDALASAGWTIIKARAGNDALVVAEYAKHGRDVFVEIHDGAVRVADVGAQSEPKQLADALAASGHVVVPGVYFDLNDHLQVGADVAPASETALAHVVELMQHDGKLSLEVGAHIRTGKADQSLALSEARAKAVVAWLVAHGAPAGRLTAKGYGLTAPIADENKQEGRAANRRIELTRK